MHGDDAVRALREALQLTPDNQPLRRHLAETLLGLGRADEAEAVFREALATSPDDQGLKVGLARAYYQQGKKSHALVIVEDLAKLAEPPAEGLVLYARLLSAAGDEDRAGSLYRRAVEADPSVHDTELDSRFGVGEQLPYSDDDEDEFGGRVPTAWDESEGDAPPADIERPKIKFHHVGGMDKLKEEIRMKIIYPMSHADMFKAYGKSIGGGILMYGPPGCGKTHLARATAGEINARFIAVGISDVLDMWIGNSEKNLHELFEQARANQPCVLFFDEVDALGASRSDLRHSGARHLVNQFLSELDGVESSNEGLLILAATNAPWHLDSAFRRPGRFDRILFVPPPDTPARAAILRLLCEGKPQDRLDFDQVAKKTDGFSGADLKAVVDQAIEAKLAEAMRTGKPEPLSSKDLVSAAKGIKATTREWFSTARNYALYSNQGGLYDDILKYLNM